MINQNSDENKKQPMEQSISKLNEAMNELTLDPMNAEHEITLKKGDKKKNAKQKEEVESFIENKSDNMSSENNQYKSSEVISMSSQDQFNSNNEHEVTIHKRNRIFHQAAEQSMSLLASLAKSDDANTEYYYEGSIYQQESEESEAQKQDDLEDIGKVSTSRSKNLFLFNSSISQHRLISKQLEKMKSKCSLNVQLKQLDSKKENNDEDENEVEEDEDDEDEVEFEDEEDQNGKQKDEKLEFDKKQKSWKKKLVNDYLILEILGNGGQGKVATFLDKNNNHIIALKEFARINEFDRESKIYKFLQEQTDLHDYINLMLDEDRSQRQIKMQMGSCNLYEMYVQMKNQNNQNKQQICWGEDNLVKIFRQLIHGLIAFRKKNFFHGDIKPHNLMLFSAENVFNHYMVKYIDLGAAGFETKDYYEFYSDQFYHPEYLDMIVMKEYILTDVEVNICEIYAIVRSIWILLCYDRDDLNNFKTNTDLNFGLQFIRGKYQRLADLIQKVLDSKGDLDEIRQIIDENQLNESIVNPLNTLCLIDPSKLEEGKAKYAQFDINQNYLKLNDQMKELIQKIIQMKKEKFINEQSEEQLQELFEVFYSLGQDQRALEIFHQLEPSYERLFKKYLVTDSGKSPNKKLTESNVYCKVRVIKESIILLNEKGELDKAILWNKRLLNLFSSGKWQNSREAILSSIQYSILLNTKGDVMASLQMSKDARNRYKMLLWEQSKENKELFKTSLYKDTLYGYICQVIGRLYVEINSFSNGLKYLKIALQIFEAAKRENERGEDQHPTIDSEVEYEDLNNMIQLTLIKLSQASLFLRHNNKALEFIDSAINLGKIMYGDRVNKQQASCLNIKSHILKQQNMDLQALELQNKCLEIRLKIHNQIDHRFISNSLNSISLLESKLGFHEQALLNLEQCYQMRLRLYQKNNPYHNQIISCLRNFGIIYQKMQNFTKAEEYFLQAYEMSQNSNDLFQKINSLKLVEKLYKQIHDNEKYRQYQNLRIKAKQELLDVKKNIHHQKIDQTNETVATASNRKLSSYTEMGGSPVLQSSSQYSDDESHIHNSNESKKLVKSQQKRNQKLQLNSEDSLTLSHQDSIQLTHSYPLTIAQPANKKANSNKSKNKRYSVIKSNVPNTTETQVEVPKPRPKYKKKTRNLHTQVIQEEGTAEQKDENSAEKTGHQQLLESQPIKDQIQEKKNYKKNGGRRTSKKKSLHLKSQTELGEGPPPIIEENLTLQKKKTINNDDEDQSMVTKRVIKHNSNNKPQQQQSEGLADHFISDDNQKINQKQPNSNNKNNKNQSDSHNERKSINKPRVGSNYSKYQKSKQYSNKLIRDNVQEQEYVEVLQTEIKPQQPPPKKEGTEEKSS